MINDRLIAGITRSLSFLFALAGLIVHIASNAMGAGVLMYYTIQSNILVVALLAYLSVKTWYMYARHGRHGTAGLVPRVEMVVTVDILLTFFVYWLLLAQPTAAAGYNIWTFDNLAVHGITPILCLLDYIFYTKSKHLKYRDVYLVCGYPLLYVLGTSIAGLSGYVYSTDAEGIAVRFPYFFFDFDRLGAFALLYITALLVVFIGISHLIYLLDRKVKKPQLLPRVQTFTDNQA